MWFTKIWFQLRVKADSDALAAKLQPSDEQSSQSFKLDELILPAYRITLHKPLVCRQ
jgi:hypothetical protein